MQYCVSYYREKVRGNVSQCLFPFYALFNGDARRNHRRFLLASPLNLQEKVEDEQIRLPEGEVQGGD